MNDYFHYSEDPTEQKLLEALEELMRHKAIAEITTSELLDLSGVSRSTFYRKYKDKQDLMNKNYQHLLDKTMQGMVDGKSYKEATYVLLNALKESPSFFRDAFQTRGGENSLGRYIQDTLYKTFHKTLEHFGIDMSKRYYQLLLHGYLCAAMELLYEWVDNDMQEDVGEIFHINYELMPTEIRSVIMLHFMS